ncbi:hypothetical protein LTS18_003108 [Coniosporium uncinatum]|uniref:Uncharacterized protein n=1 Tax=Coniosporium uncinatum TaxID=93489 RepID=A0ACC3DY25_9PEZI|nr:hypothetical protein LTS18_003108 [Coniosporium uncinatum]
MIELQRNANGLYKSLLSSLKTERKGRPIRIADRSSLKLQRQLEEITENLLKRGDQLAELELDLGAAEHKLKSREETLYNEIVEALQRFGSLGPARERAESSLEGSEEDSTDPQVVQDYYSLLGDLRNFVDALNELDIGYQQDMVEHQRAATKPEAPNTRSLDLLNEYITERNAILQELRKTEKAVKTVKEHCVAAGFTVEDDERPYFATNVMPGAHPMEGRAYSSTLVNTTSGIHEDSRPIEPVRYVLAGAQDYTSDWLTNIMTTDEVEQPEDPDVADVVLPPLADNADDEMELLRRSSYSGIDQSEAACLSETVESRPTLEEKHLQTDPRVTR